MPLVRHYLMIARPEDIGALQTALEKLRDKVTPLAGCLGVELYQDTAKPERFFFLERWESVAAHKAGGAMLGKDAFAPIMAVLASPPEAASLNPL